DEAIFVVSGDIVTGSGELRGGDAFICESNALGSVTASSHAEVLHFGGVSAHAPSSGPFGPPSRPARRVHVATASRHGEQRGPRVDYFADGSCPGCRIMLFSVTSSDAYVGPSHSHSEDELIYVIDGGIRVGREHVGSAMALFVPADRRYSFRSEGSFRFVNY